MKISLHSYANKTNFHMKSFSLSLVFIVWFKATWKWRLSSNIMQLQFSYIYPKFNFFIEECFQDCFTIIYYFFCFPQTYIFMFKNITLSVPGAVITGMVCILLLILLKFISEKLKHKMKFPIPAELIVVC